MRPRSKGEDLNSLLGRLCPLRGAARLGMNRTWLRTEILEEWDYSPSPQPSPSAGRGRLGNGVLSGGIEGDFPLCDRGRVPHAPPCWRGKGAQTCLVLSLPGSPALWAGNFNWRCSLGATDPDFVRGYRRKKHPLPFAGEGRGEGVLKSFTLPFIPSRRGRGNERAVSWERSAAISHCGFCFSRYPNSLSSDETD